MILVAGRRVVAGTAAPETHSLEEAEAELVGRPRLSPAGTADQPATRIVGTGESLPAYGDDPIGSSYPSSEMRRTAGTPTGMETARVVGYFTFTRMMATPTSSGFRVRPSSVETGRRCSRPASAVDPDVAVDARGAGVDVEVGQRDLGAARGEGEPGADVLELADDVRRDLARLEDGDVAAGDREDERTRAQLGPADRARGELEAASGQRRSPGPA